MTDQFPDISELDDTAQLIRVSWTKALNYWASLARTMFETKAILDSGKYGPTWNSGRWFMTKAGISEGQFNRMLLVFKNAIAAENRERLEAAQIHMRAEKRDAREAKRAVAAAAREQKQAQREANKIANEQKRAEKAAEKRRAAANARARERYKEQKIARRQQAVAEGQDVLTTLVAQIKAGQIKARQGHLNWIEGTLEQAVALAVARERFAANQVFGDWLVQNEIFYSPDDRAALINMGMHAEITRTVLLITERQSIQLIWRNEIKPEVEKIHLRSSTNIDLLH